MGTLGSSAQVQREAATVYRKEWWSRPDPAQTTELQEPPRGWQRGHKQYNGAGAWYYFFKKETETVAAQKYSQGSLLPAEKNTLSLSPLTQKLLSLGFNWLHSATPPDLILLFSLLANNTIFLICFAFITCFKDSLCIWIRGYQVVIFSKTKL